MAKASASERSGRPRVENTAQAMSNTVKATLSVTIDNERDVLAVTAWLNRWGNKLKLSDKRGCGCCVDIWDVQAPQQALSELPSEMVAVDGV